MSAHAVDKVSAVQDKMSEACGRKVESSEALRYMRELFLSCKPKSEVKIDGCKPIQCLREDSGNVVGS